MIVILGGVEGAVAVAEAGVVGARAERRNWYAGVMPVPPTICVASGRERSVYRTIHF